MNKIKYGIEQNLNVQENLDFSKEHKENLEFHLKQDLNNYLAPIYTSQQPMLDSNIIVESSQGHINNTNI